MKHLSSLIVLCLLTSCHTLTSNPSPLTVKDVTHDTLYLSNHHYDSIYIHTDHTTEYHPSKDFLTTLNTPNTLNSLNPLHSPNPLHSLHPVDTLFVHDKELQYRYRLLRDTLRIHEVDSIPVIHTVEVTREVTHIPWLVRTLAWIGAISILILFLRLYLKSKP